MKLEVGKEYLRRDGLKVKVVEYRGEGWNNPFVTEDGILLTDEGYFHSPNEHNERDLVNVAR